MKTRLSLVLLLSFASIASTTYAQNDDHLVAGVQAFRDGKYGEAASQLKQSLAAHPNSTAALFLANSYIKLGRYQQAKGALNQALQIDPGTPKRATIEDLIKKIDEGFFKPAAPAPAPKPAAPVAAPTPKAAPVAAPTPAPAPAPAPAASAAAETPTDQLLDFDCAWFPFKEAWACPVPNTFEGGRFATPPDYRQDDVSEQKRRHSWVAALKVTGTRSNGRVGAFVPNKDGTWLFVPGPLWSPHDLVFMPLAKAATASTTPAQ
jgi:hypothetical protein